MVGVSQPNDSVLVPRVNVTHGVTVCCVVRVTLCCVVRVTLCCVARVTVCCVVRVTVCCVVRVTLCCVVCCLMRLTVFFNIIRGVTVLLYACYNVLCSMGYIMSVTL